MRNGHDDDATGSRPDIRALVGLRPADQTLEFPALSGNFRVDDDGGDRCQSSGDTVARAESPGNFSGSCKNLALNATNFSKSATLTADCRKQDGTYLKAEVNLNDLITNNHGSLQWGHSGGADFQQSCSGDALSGSKLSSFCVESAEVKKSTQIDLNEKITNDNGKLTYIGDQSGVVDTGPPPPPPHGRTMNDLVGIAAGVDNDRSAQADLLNKIVDLGLHRVRVDFTWDDIEHTQGQ